MLLGEMKTSLPETLQLGKELVAASLPWPLEWPHIFAPEFVGPE